MHAEASAITEFTQALLQIDRIRAREIFARYHAQTDSFAILESMAIHSLEHIGSGWEQGTVSLSQVYMSGVICEELFDAYVSHTAQQRHAPKMAIAVLQDQHALGKRIVLSVLRAAGFEVLDFGQGLSAAEIVQKTVSNDIEILLISTLMLHSALLVRTIKDELLAREHVIKIIVGGAPFRLDPSLWRTVGADADGKNATNVIATIEQVIKGGN